MRWTVGKKPPPAGVGSLKRKCALACAAFSVSFLFAELVLRLAHGAPLPERLPVMQVRANQTRGWEMVPSRTHYNYVYKVEVNDWGLRGPCRGEKAPAETRVLALGDSLVYGQGVPEEATIPSLMERMLNAGGGSATRLTVVNGGMRAYATNQELALLRELGPRIAPDAVVLFWYWNDLEDADVATLYARMASRGEVAFGHGAPLEGWRLVGWHMTQAFRRSAVINGVHDLVRSVGADFPETAAIERGMRVLEAHLAEFAAVCDELGCHPLVVVVPDAGELRGSHPAAVITRRAEEVVLKSGLPTASPRPALEELVRRSGRLPVVPFDGHYDADANATIAAAAVAALNRLRE